MQLIDFHLFPETEKKFGRRIIGGLEEKRMHRRRERRKSKLEAEVSGTIAFPL